MNLISCPLKDLLIERHETIKQEDFLAESYQRLLKIDFNGTIHFTANGGKSPLRAIKPGDLIFSRINAGRGAISIHKGTENLASTKHYAIFGIHKEIIIPELLLHLLRSSEMLKRYSEQLRPGIKSELSNRTFLQYELSFPASQNDQQSLLLSLQSRMQKLQKVENSIQEFKGQIDIIRQKLLQEYFTERSSLHLKQNNSSKYKPKAWSYKKLTEIASLKVGKTPQNRHFSRNGIPFLKVQNIVKQVISTESAVFHITPECFRKQFKTLPSLPGDILMNIVGPPLGKIAVFPEYLIEAGYNQGLVNIRPKETELGRWIFWFLNEMSAIRRLPRSGIAGQENLSVKQIRNIAVPLPETEQRKMILSHLERHLSLLENLELRCTHLSLLIDVLKAKIISYTLSLSNKNG